MGETLIGAQEAYQRLQAKLVARSFNEKLLRILASEPGKLPDTPEVLMAMRDVVLEVLNEERSKKE